MGWLVQSPLNMRIGRTCRRGAQIGGLARNGLIPLGDTWRVRVFLPSMTTLIIRSAFRTLVIFHGPVLRSRSSLPSLPFRSTLLLDSFTNIISPVELQSLPIPLLFCCLLLVGRWPYFDGAFPGPVVLP